MHVRKLTGAAGAEIKGIDLAALNDAGFAQLQRMLWDHGVVAIRDQDLSPEAHIAFAERWGRIDINRFFTPVPGHPKIAEVRTKAEQIQVIGGEWHTDHSYDPAPAMISILVARELPEFGGDTCFASQTAAYQNLSDGLRATLEGLKAWHSDGSFADSAAELGVGNNVGVKSLHPIIITHPQSGEKALYVNGDFTTHIDGWSVQESAPMLKYLYEFCTQPTLQCRINYQPGTVVIWDNRLVQHYAVADYQGQARLMHRVTVEGQALS